MKERPELCLFLMPCNGDDQNRWVVSEQDILFHWQTLLITEMKLVWGVLAWDAGQPRGTHRTCNLHSPRAPWAIVTEVGLIEVTVPLETADHCQSGLCTYRHLAPSTEDEDGTEVIADGAPL